MHLKAYVNRLVALLDTHPYLEARQIVIDERPPDAAFVRLEITFIDGSKLHFKEFLIIQHRSKVIKYGYQYLAEDNSLVFRYDNALDPAARDLSTYPEHKHTAQGIVAAPRIEHEALFQEISDVIACKDKRESI
jgi:hypothetical protein